MTRVDEGFRHFVRSSILLLVFSLFGTMLITGLVYLSMEMDLPVAFSIIGTLVGIGYFLFCLSAVVTIIMKNRRERRFPETTGPR
jgi:hypothetical protein